jgi:hypothetical protein
MPSDILNGIIADLRVLIDQIDNNSKTFKELLLEVALGRWSIIEQTLNRYRDFAIQANIVRYQQQQQQRQIQQQQQMWQKQVDNSAPSPPLLGYNLQQQQNQQKQQQQKLPTIDDILAEEERRILCDLESMEL